MKERLSNSPLRVPRSNADGRFMFILTCRAKPLFGLFLPVAHIKLCDIQQMSDCPLIYELFMRAVSGP